jgi:pyruvate kinase
MIRARRARIVATLGPASRAPGMVKALAQAGVDVFRLNFSHGSHDDHAAALKAVRGAEMALQRPLGVLADLQGPKLRLGRFKDVEIDIKPGHRMRFDLDPTPGDETRVQMPHPEIFKALRTGNLLLLDDGRVRLRVNERHDTWADVTVESGHKLSDRKGVAVPEAVIPVSALTPKDREDLAFALRIGVDWVALSFVQKAEDMAELKRLVGGKAACLAKIEKPQALHRPRRHPGLLRRRHGRARRSGRRDGSRRGAGGPEGHHPRRPPARRAGHRRHPDAGVHDQLAGPDAGRGLRRRQRRL